MTIARPTIFWIATCAIVVAALILLRPILLPFALGATLAYLLAPAIDRLERTGMNRALAAVTVVLVLVIGLAGPVLVLLPTLLDEAGRFLAEFPHAVARVQARLADTSQPWLQKIMREEVRIGESATGAAEAMGRAWLDDFIRSAWSGGQALFSFLSLLVVVPIITIYLLVDWNRMFATVDGWLPIGRQDEIRALGREINHTVLGFVRGQIVVCLILAVFYAAALSLIELDHAIVIGLASGLTSFVPYLGAGSGLVVSLCVAVDQFWLDWTRLALVGGIFLVGEILADHVLSPRFIGSRVKLSPLWLMFSLFAFGYLFGFVGLLVAIPLAASLGVILRFVMVKSLAGSLPNAEAAPSAAVLAGPVNGANPSGTPPRSGDLERPVGP